jgi:CBS domain-containing protein
MSPTTWGTTAQRRPPERVTVGEVMTPNPVSISAAATLEEAVTFLVDSGFSAAPVIDEAGRPVGVISRTDVVVYDRERLILPKAAPYYFESADEIAAVIHEEQAATRVADLMTPAIFSVNPDTPLDEAAERMTELHVHRLFVVDGSRVLVGVVSALDLLRLLTQTPAAAEGASR